MGSDHFPIFINAIGFYVNRSRVGYGTNWDRYRKHLAIVSGDMFQDTLASKHAAMTTVRLPEHFLAVDLKLRILAAARRKEQQPKGN